MDYFRVNRAPTYGPGPRTQMWTMLRHNGPDCRELWFIGLSSHMMALITSSCGREGCSCNKIWTILQHNGPECLGLWTGRPVFRHNRTQAAAPLMHPRVAMWRMHKIWTILQHNGPNRLGVWGRFGRAGERRWRAGAAAGRGPSGGQGLPLTRHSRRRRRRRRRR